MLPLLPPRRPEARPTARLRRGSGVTAGLLLCAAGLAACGPDSSDPEPEPSFATDLIEHGPDELIGELGVIEASAAGALDAVLVSGWEAPVEGGRSLRTDSTEARLHVQFSRRRDVATEWTVSSERTGFIELEVNGAVLPTALEVGPEAETQLLEIAAASLRRGDNSILLRRMLPAIEDEASAERDPLDLELYKLEWGRTQEAERTQYGDELMLTAGGSAGYRLELPEGANLSIKGSANNSAELLIELLPIDPLTGAIRGQGEPYALPLEPGVFREEIFLPGSPSGLCELWLSVENDGAPVVIDTLDLAREGLTKPPSILFLSVDTLAAQNMSLYGYGRDTTPNMRRFAKDAIVFERARSNAPWTVPSYVSQLSGQFPEANAAADPGQGREAYELFEIPRNRWTMAEMFRGLGYRTIGLPDNLWLSLVAGIGQGFEVFDIEAAELAHGIDFNGGMYNVFPKIVAHLAEARSSERPAFIFAQVFDVHGPYYPSEEFAGRFSGELTSDDELLVTEHNPIMFGTIPSFAFPEAWTDLENVPEQFDPDIIQARYDEKIAELDQAFGKLIEDIDALGMDDLIIVVSADHGESMQDHEFYFRHGLLYEDTVHVPLIVRLPEGELGGTRIEEPVQLVDLYPTFCELAGVDAQRPYLHGRSLAGHLGLGERTDPAPTLAMAKFKSQQAIGFDRWKVVRSDFSRSADPTKLSQSQILVKVAERRREDLDRVLGDDWAELDRVELSRRILESRLRMKELTDEMWRVRRIVQDMGLSVEVFEIVDDPREQNDLAAEQGRLKLDALREFEHYQTLIESTRALGAFGDGNLPPSEEDLRELERLGYATKGD